MFQRSEKKISMAASLSVRKPSKSDKSKEVDRGSIVIHGKKFGLCTEQ